MKNSKFFLPSIMLLASMAMNAQTMSVHPEGETTTHSDQFFVGQAASISFADGKMTVTPASGKGAAQTYDVSATPASLQFSDQTVVPVNLRDIPGLTYGMTTLVAPETLDLSAISVANDLKAYYATSVSESSINLAAVTVIGKEQAAILSGEQGWYCIPVNNSASLSPLTNLFRGSLTDSYTVKATDNIYAFSITRASFCPVSAGVTIGAGKAYLPAPQGTASSLSLNFDALTEEETSIGAVSAGAATDAHIYNVAGQHVSPTANGIIISNHKKVMK